MIYLDCAASSPPWPETARDPRPSHVLLAMGYSEQRARQSVRFSLGRMTTMEEIGKTIQAVKRIYSSKERFGPGTRGRSPG